MASSPSNIASQNATRGWDPHKTYDLSEKEMKAIEERAEMRRQLKAEFQKKFTDPHKGVGGYVVSDLRLRIRFAGLRLSKSEPSQTTII